MSNDNLQMHQINSTSSFGGDSASLSHNQNSSSSASMAPKSNVQFASDSPITDPGQKVSKHFSNSFIAKNNSNNFILEHYEQ